MCIGFLIYIFLDAKFRTKWKKNKNKQSILKYIQRKELFFWQKGSFQHRRPLLIQKLIKTMLPIGNKHWSDLGLVKKYD